MGSRRAARIADRSAKQTSPRSPVLRRRRGELAHSHRTPQSDRSATPAVRECNSSPAPLGPASRRVGSVPGTCSRCAQIVDDSHSQAFIAAKVRIVEADLKTSQCKIITTILHSSCETTERVFMPLVTNHNVIATAKQPDAPFEAPQLAASRIRSNSLNPLPVTAR
jgi:hypothetical protein